MNKREIERYFRNPAKYMDEMDATRKYHLDNNTCSICGDPFDRFSARYCTYHLEVIEKLEKMLDK